MARFRQTNSDVCCIPDGLFLNGAQKAQIALGCAGHEWLSRQQDVSRVAGSLRGHRNDE